MEQEIYVINMDKNVERKSNMIRKFSKYFKINFIQSVENKNPVYSCFLSHLKCIQIAKKNKFKYIIVLEDDCILNDKNDNDEVNFETTFYNILKYLNSDLNQWNLFLGGITKCYEYNIHKIEIYKNQSFLHTRKGKTFHFVIYNQNCYDFFLNYKFDNTPIDKIWNFKLNAIIPIPFIAYQEDGFSDIEQKNISYYHRYKSIENNLIKYHLPT